MHPDYVDIVEAAYRIECDEATWLGGIMGAIRPALDRGLGLWLVLYDASHGGHPRIEAVEHTGRLPWSVPGLATRLIGEATRTYDDAPLSFGPAPCAVASEACRVRGIEEMLAELRPLGVADVLGAHGADPEGRGVLLGAHLPSRGGLPVGQRTVWSRVVAHIAAAYRLRRKLAAGSGCGGDLRDETAAVVCADGTIAARAGDSPDFARRALSDAAIALDRARGRQRRDAPERALAEWRGLVAARWTLLDVFDRSGRRYLVARRNEPAVPRIEKLTDRERQVVAYAILGHQNKLIAYELGLATSTVGVLLSRAFAKLGVHNRRELFALMRPCVKPGA
jgi:DNA-binding CsgD family transcriptional regulator